MNKKSNWVLGLACVLGISTAASASSIILNEYNGVKSTSYLKDSKSDTYFGRIVGNGGNWFELVTTDDNIDMRGWTLNWKEASKAGTIYLSDNSFWSNVRQGLILTFIEDPNTGGGKDTDTTYNYSDDWWVNICTLSEQNLYNTGNSSWLARTVYTPASGGNAGDFTTSNDNWQLQILDKAGAIIMNWTGEGISTSGIGGDEVFKLELNPSSSITPTTGYKDGTSSSFGSPNLWSSGTGSQDFSALRVGIPEPMTIAFLVLGSIAGIYRKKQ